jgi:hypothetical protein
MLKYNLLSHFIQYTLRRNVFQIYVDINDICISCYEHVFERRAIFEKADKVPFKLHVKQAVISDRNELKFNSANIFLS